MELKRKAFCAASPDKEWVAVLLYYLTDIKGKIDIEILDMYLFHFAEGMAFDFKTKKESEMLARAEAEAVGYAMDKGYDLMRLQKGFVHSHCSLPPVASFPDIAEMKSNAGNHYMYLFLITNNKGVWGGNIAQKVKMQKKDVVKMTYFDRNKNLVTKLDNREKTVDGVAIHPIEYTVDAVQDEITDMIENARKNSQIKHSVNQAKSWEQGLPGFVKGYTPMEEEEENLELVTEEDLALFLTGTQIILYSDVKNLKYSVDKHGPQAFLKYMDKVLQENAQGHLDMTDPEILAEILDEALETLEGSGKSYLLETAFIKNLINDYIVFSDSLRLRAVVK